MRSLILSILLSTATSLFAQTNIRASVDTTMALVGDIINLSIEVETTEPLSWPNLEKEISPLEVQKYNTIDTIDNKGVFHYSQKTAIQYFDTGLVYIPSLDFINSLGDTFSTDSIAIAYLSFQLDTTNAYFDIKSPKKVPFNFEEAKPYIYSSIALILLIALLIFLIKKYKTKDEEIIPIVPIIPSNIEAVNALKALEKENLCDRGLAKEHYLKLSAILRHYFDREFSIDSMESTTDETIELLNSNVSNSELIEKIHQLLADADLVKFAKLELDLNTNKLYLDRAYQIIESCHNLRKEGQDV